MAGGMVNSHMGLWNQKGEKGEALALKLRELKKGVVFPSAVAGTVAGDAREGGAKPRK